MNRLSLAPTTLPDTPPLDYLEAAIDAGYDTIGLRLVRSPGLPFRQVLGDEPLIRELKRRIADAPLTVLDIFSFYLQPATRLDAYTPALELGAELGARYVLVMGDDPDRARLVNNFGAFCARAASCGLTAAIEFAPTRSLATLGQSVELIAETGVPNAVICLDPLNLARCGDGAAAVRAVDPRMFPYAQLTDGVLGPGEPDLSLLGRMAPAQRRLLGQGTLPLAEILDALPADLPLSIELPVPKGVAVSTREWARRALDDTRRFLEGYRQAKKPG
jgi:sugar phosphate isomerase/epimerase